MVLKKNFARVPPYVDFYGVLFLQKKLQKVLQKSLQTNFLGANFFGKNFLGTNFFETNFFGTLFWIVGVGVLLVVM